MICYLASEQSELKENQEFSLPIPAHIPVDNLNQGCGLFGFEIIFTLLERFFDIP